MADLVRAANPTIADEIDTKMKAAQAALKVIKDSGDSGDMYYDMMLAEGNTKGNKMIQDGVDALVAQAMPSSAAWRPSRSRSRWKAPPAWIIPRPRRRSERRNPRRPTGAAGKGLWGRGAPPLQVWNRI